MNDISVVLQTGTAVCATVAAVYLAARIIEGNDDWPKFILYLGALRVALNGGSTAPRAFGTVSRYYPRLVVFIQFLQSAARLDEEVSGRARLDRLPAGVTVLVHRESAGVGAYHE